MDHTDLIYFLSKIESDDMRDINEMMEQECPGGVCLLIDKNKKQKKNKPIDDIDDDDVINITKQTNIKKTKKDNNDTKQKIQPIREKQEKEKQLKQKINKDNDLKQKKSKGKINNDNNTYINNINFGFPSKTIEWTCYGSKSCGSCENAKQLFKEKNISFSYYDINDIGGGYLVKTKLYPLIGNYNKIPIIFHYEKFIGGYSNLTKYFSK
jgi:glutaredoxin